MRLVHTIASAVLDPIFFIMVYVSYLFYKKNVQLEKQMLTFSQSTAQNKTIDAALHGMITGLLGSRLMQIVGLPLEITKGTLLLLPIAMLLSLRNPRFACFSYAAPILGITSLLVPNFRFDILGMISLVASLHFMEAVLVYLTGAKGSIPVMVQHQGSYIGAYTMQKYWPIPIALMTPLQGLSPLCGILGFGSIALTTTPEKKARKMGLLLGLYALLILGGAKIAYANPTYKLAILLLMPLLHEIIYYLDHHFETSKPPIYTNPFTGIRVLDVKRHSYGHKMGIKRGDIIHQFNNCAVNNAPQYYRLLKEGHHTVTLHITRLNGKRQTLRYQATTHAAIIDLGIVPLPTYSFVIQAI